METVYEGSWDELAVRQDELRGRRLRLTVLEAPDDAAIRDRRERFRQGLLTIEKVGHEKGPFATYKMDANFFYPDDEARA